MSETLTPTRQPVTPAADDAPEALARIAPRGLVPTGRQAHLGIVATEVAPLTKEETARRKPVREAVRLFLDGYDVRKVEGPKLPLLVFLITALTFDAANATIAILLPEIRSEFGVSLVFLVTIGNVVAFVGLAMALPLGYFADRWNRVWMMRVGMMGQALTLFAQAFAASPAGLFLARLAGGIIGTVDNPTAQPLIADYYGPRARPRVYALRFAGTVLGPMLGALLGGVVGYYYGWRYAVAALGLIATVAALLTFLLREPKRGEVDRLELGMSEEDAARQPAPLSFAQSLRTAWSIRTLRFTIAAQAIVGVALFISAVVTPIFLAEYYYFGPLMRALVIGLAPIWYLIGLGLSGPVVTRLLNRPGRIFVLTGTVSMLTAGLYLGFAFVPPYWVVFPFGVALGLAGGIIAPAGLVLTTLVVPARVRGLGLQIQAPFVLLTLLLVQVSIMIIGDNLRFAWIVMAVAIAVSGLITFAGVSGVERDVRAAQAVNAAEVATEEARRTGTNKMLLVRDLDVRYASVQVLFGVNLDVDEGEIVALLGTNGAGKSTVLRAICGLQPAYSGAVFVDGADVTYAPPHENAARGIVMMPGGQAVFPALSVAANLRAAAHLHRKDERYVAEQTERVLEMFPVLRERLDQLAGSLSGGEQQQLALGQAFLMKPRLLMIDELSLGLAPAIVERLLDTLREIHASGTTIILVEQSVNVALTIAGRAVFMDKGAIEFDGATEELLRRPDLLRSVFMGAGAGAGAPAGTRRRRLGHDEENETVLEVAGLGVSFGGIQALGDVSMQVAGGEIVGIIGPNGAGKTTLFDCISGFVPPDSGTIAVAGTDVSSARPDVRARLGLTRSFQNARLFPSLTVREAITAAFERKSVRSAALAAVWAPAVRRSERKLDRYVTDLIERLGLPAYADKFVAELSTGTRRAVDVACVLALEPKILLLDEPTSGLAQAETEALGPLIRQIVRESGCGVLIIEHDIPLITSVSDRLYAMELGNVIASGTPQEVTTDPAVLASYLTASQDVIYRSDSRAAAIAAALGQPVAAAPTSPR